MHKAVSPFAAFAAVLATLASVSTARAQVPQTWVSDGGSNANDCLSAAQPCRTIGGATGALSKTVAGGIIHVLPGSYQGFAIDKSIDIIADQGQAAITAGLQTNGTFTAGISVETAATDIVRVRGFEVAPIVPATPPSGGFGGIMLHSAGVLHVENCTFVRGESGYGIVIAPTGVGELHVSNAIVSDNGSGGSGGGILIKPAGSGSANVVIEDIHVGNNVAGIRIDGRFTTGTNSVTIRNSTFAGSTGNGLLAIDSGGGATDVTIEGSTFSSNGNNGVGSSGVNTTVRMRNSTATGNLRGILAGASGKLISNGGNVVRGNTTNGAFTSTEAQQ